jgi:hypothetical protein
MQYRLSFVVNGNFNITCNCGRVSEVMARILPTDHFDVVLANEGMHLAVGGYSQYYTSDYWHIALRSLSSFQRARNGTATGKPLVMWATTQTPTDWLRPLDIARAKYQRRYCDNVETVARLAQIEGIPLIDWNGLTAALPHNPEHGVVHYTVIMVKSSNSNSSTCCFKYGRQLSNCFSILSMTNSKGAYGAYVFAH